MKALALSFVASLAVGGCTLEPGYQRPDLPTATSWPSDAHTATEVAPTVAAPAVPADQIGWRDFFDDVRLKRLIEIALENNRNLRVAVLNVAASQAQFHVQRGALFPTISATGSATAEKISLAEFGLPGGAVTAHEYSASIGFTSYELDVFGRQRSLTHQAFEEYLAEAETRRSVQISLVSEVAADYFAVLADEALLKITADTLKSQSATYDLTKAMYDHDTTTLLSLRQAESTVDSARASLAQYQRQLALDQHALVLVLGEPLPEDLPPEPTLDNERLLEEVPAGLPSDLLTRRPDILSAEHTLLGANANIGAARAAFFPSITLTASDGSASSKLQNLFSKGTGTWTFAPTINLPIFTGGQNLANLKLSHVQKDISIAQYELAIQTAYHEVSDALASRSTYRQQLLAQDSLVAADAEAYRLAELRYRSGVDSFLNTLDSERSLYSAQQQQVQLKVAALANMVTLYKALGGGWKQRTVSAD